MALLRTTNQPYYSSEKANCEAMAFCLGEQYIKTTGGEKSGGVFNIEKGGHCVFVMGQGNNKVISDAWSGQAYPVYDVVKSLWDFRRYIVDDPHNREVPRKINVLTTCNPRYSLSPVVSYIPAREKQGNITPDQICYSSISFFNPTGKASDDDGMSMDKCELPRCT